MIALSPHWFQILLALADEDPHGLAIMHDVLERTGGAVKLWPGMLYLARLVERRGSWSKSRRRRMREPEAAGRASII